MDIITLSEYKSYDDVPSPSDGDNQIDFAIDLSTSLIEKRTGRVFQLGDNPSPIDVLETINGLGTKRLFVRQSPVIEVSKIEYYDGTQWQEQTAIEAPRTFKPDSNIIYFTDGFKAHKGYENWRVTYTYGYLVSLPNDLKFACYKIAKWIIDESNRQGMRNQSDGEQSFEYFAYNKNLPEEAVGVVERYKTVW